MTNVALELEPLPQVVNDRQPLRRGIANVRDKPLKGFINLQTWHLVRENHAKTFEKPRSPCNVALCIAATGLGLYINYYAMGKGVQPPIQKTFDKKR